MIKFKAKLLRLVKKQIILLKCKYFINLKIKIVLNQSQS